jgi:A/G-specific adenine glycosylase
MSLKLNQDGGHLKNESLKIDAKLLVDWYRGVKRELPWRIDQDPYRIWISEVMLQQTTVTAVIPYYDRFMARFPHLQSLAEAPLESVLEHWAGLGYYTRARNLHKAALKLNAIGGFPKSYLELIEMPGFGPYTARAVSSLAFNEKVGVLDGNVIRVLSRRYGLSEEWWKPKGREVLQSMADLLAQIKSPSDLNQGLMELGATVCTPTSPACLICPWVKSCVARNTNRIADLPLKRPRREREIWLWKPAIIKKNKTVLFISNDYAPFLKGHWMPPGKAEQLTKAPINFDYRGSVTHHDIYVQVTRINEKLQSLPKSKSVTNSQNQKWIALQHLSSEAPSSLIRKAIAIALNSTTIIAIMAFTVLFMSVGCKSNTKIEFASQGNIDPTKPLTTSGQNSNARFSFDGKRILYISRGRSQHRQAQVYELNLENMNERRITFHDGDDSGADYLPSLSPQNEKIVYASSTDEIKEEPLLEKTLHANFSTASNSNPMPASPTPAATLPPEPTETREFLAANEIYVQNLKSGEIERLTQLPGFDAQPGPHPQHSTILYTSAHNEKRNDMLRVYILESNGDTWASPRLLLKSDSSDSSARFSPDGKNLLWIRKSKDGLETTLMTASMSNLKGKVLAKNVLVNNVAAKNVLAIGSLGNLKGNGSSDIRPSFLNPSWHPNSRQIIYATNARGSNYDLFTIDTESQCLKQITTGPGDKLEPAFSPDGKKVAFTWRKDELSQIHLIDFRPSETCL